MMLVDLLDTVGPDLLETLLFDPVDPDDLDWHLARLSHRVAPVYLPLATDDSGVLALHLWPGRAVKRSPIVYVGEDQCDVHYLCDGLHNLPTALWLWMGRYFKKRLPDLKEAVTEMAARIPGGRPVPDALWPLLETAPDYEPTWWHADGAETTQQAWQLAGVGHPFVGVPDPGRRAKPAEALDLLAPFVEAHREPELVSLLIAAQVKAGLDVTYDDVAFVLGAEAWRQSGNLLGGRWRVRGEGVCAWDAVLRHLPDRSILADTPFAELINHPAAYSGEDREGPLALGRVALTFYEAGEAEAALRQARNALQVAVLALGRYPKELALTAARIGDAVAPDAPASWITRRSVAIDREAL